MKLGGKANAKGEIRLETFSHMVWSKLYKGDLALVSAGSEDLFAIHHDKHDSWKQYLKETSFEHDGYIYSYIGDKFCEKKDVVEGHEIRLVREAPAPAHTIKRANPIAGSPVGFNRDTKGTFRTDFAQPL